MDLAGGHHHQPVGGQRQAQLVQHRDDGAVLLAGEPGHLPHQRHLMRRVEMGGRLVEQQNRRLHRQRARQQHPLALAAGQLGQAAVAPGGASGGLHRLADRLLVAPARQAEQAEMRQPAQPDHIDHRQVAAGLALLRQPGQPARALRRRPVGQRCPVEPDLAVLERLQPGQRTQQRRLAGTVGPDDRGPARAEVQVDVAQHRAIAQAHLQAAGAEHRIGHEGAAHQPILRRCSSHSR